MGDDVHIEIRKKIGANFKKIRAKKKLSLRKVEALTRIDHSWIGKFEKGQINFEIDTIISLAWKFEIDMKELFDFDYQFPSE